MIVYFWRALAELSGNNTFWINFEGGSITLK
jgi:hypothetical protein